MDACFSERRRERVVACDQRPRDRTLGRGSLAAVPIGLLLHGAALRDEGVDGDSVLDVRVHQGRETLLIRHVRIGAEFEQQLDGLASHRRIEAGLICSRGRWSSGALRTSPWYTQREPHGGLALPQAAIRVRAQLEQPAHELVVMHHVHQWRTAVRVDLVLDQQSHQLPVLRIARQAFTHPARWPSTRPPQDTLGIDVRARGEEAFDRGIAGFEG